MRTSLLSVLLLCGMQGTSSAQMGVMEPGYESELPDSNVQEILGEDFFNFRRPNTLRAAPSRSPVRMAPSGITGYGWDYRFDAQYQSTIKPHLRWYMRNDPNRPGERYLPRYMTSQGHNYSGGSFISATPAYGMPHGCSTCESWMNYAPIIPTYGALDCDTCGTGNYNQQPRSRYWRHLDYLYNQYGATQARPRRLKSPQNSPPTGKTKSVWISKNKTTNTVSVLFIQPPAAQAHRFFKGQATLTNAMKLVAINWETKPDWSDEVKLAASGAGHKS